jgi:DNA-directed RNA polymerase specialized sigma subunit
MTKEELRAYYYTKKEAQQIEQALEQLELEMENPRTTRLDAMPRACPDGTGPTERLALRHLELTELYQSKLAEMRATQLRIEQAIEQLEATERMLMRSRYIDGMTWEEVCVAMNYSWRQVHRIHAAALSHIASV